jgi:hypothetical protein
MTTSPRPEDPSHIYQHHPHSEVCRTAMRAEFDHQLSLLAHTAEIEAAVAAAKVKRDELAEELQAAESAVHSAEHHVRLARNAAYQLDLLARKFPDCVVRAADGTWKWIGPVVDSTLVENS